MLGSIIYLPAHGVRRFVPVRSRVRRAIKGLDGAASEKSSSTSGFTQPTSPIDFQRCLLVCARCSRTHLSFATVVSWRSRRWMAYSSSSSSALCAAPCFRQQ